MTQDDGSPDLWELSLDDLFTKSDPEPESEVESRGPFVIDLSTAVEPFGQLAACLRDFEHLHAYQVTDWQDDKLVFRLRLGPIESELEADAIAAIVQDDYPHAKTLVAGDDDVRLIASVTTIGEYNESVNAAASTPKPALASNAPRPKAPPLDPADGEEVSLHDLAAEILATHISEPLSKRAGKLPAHGSAPQRAPKEAANVAPPARTPHPAPEPASLPGPQPSTPERGLNGAAKLPSIDTHAKASPKPSVSTAAPRPTPETGSAQSDKPSLPARPSESAPVQEIREAPQAVAPAAITKQAPKATAPARAREPPPKASDAPPQPIGASPPNTRRAPTATPEPGTQEPPRIGGQPATSRVDVPEPAQKQAAKASPSTSVPDAAAKPPAASTVGAREHALPAAADSSRRRGGSEPPMLTAALPRKSGSASTAAASTAGAAAAAPVLTADAIARPGRKRTNAGTGTPLAETEAPRLHSREHTATTAADAPAVPLAPATAPDPRTDLLSFDFVELVELSEPAAVASAPSAGATDNRFGAPSLRSAAPAESLSSWQLADPLYPAAPDVAPSSNGAPPVSLDSIKLTLAPADSSDRPGASALLDLLADDRPDTNAPRNASAAATIGSAKSSASSSTNVHISRTSSAEHRSWRSTKPDHSPSKSIPTPVVPSIDALPPAADRTPPAPVTSRTPSRTDAALVGKASSATINAPKGAATASLNGATGADPSPSVTGAPPAVPAPAAIAPPVVNSPTKALVGASRNAVPAPVVPAATPVHSAAATEIGSRAPVHTPAPSKPGPDKPDSASVRTKPASAAGKPGLAQTISAPSKPAADAARPAPTAMPASPSTARSGAIATKPAPVVNSTPGKPAPPAAKPAATERPASSKPQTTPPAVAKTASASPDVRPGPPPSIDSTQTLRALVLPPEEEEGSEKLLVIQLALSEAEFTPEAVPNLAIFEEFSLYSAVGYESGKVMHALRLGFFTAEGPAEAVAGYLRAFFESAAVARVSAAERERFGTRRIAARKETGETGVHAAIELSSAPTAPTTSLADLTARTRGASSANSAGGNPRRSNR